MSERGMARELGQTRSTLKYWLARKDDIDADPELVAFFETEVGIAFLHRLVVAAHLAITELSPGGIRVVCQFLELTGVNAFVATSYGVQQKVHVEMEEAIISFGEEEEARLATTMPAKTITLAEDETFHPQPCLVAIEPVSGYIMLEQYSEDRKADTWTKAINKAVGEKPVEIIQSTSDEGRGICSHVKNGLGAHHSPDLFHVQHEVVKASSAPLASKKRQAEEALAKAAQAVTKQQAAKEQFYSQKRKPGRAPDFDKRIKMAQEVEERALTELATRQARQERVQNANRALSAAYHPYDLDTGQARAAAAVSAALTAQFSAIATAAQEAGLSDRSLKGIVKAQRVLVQMVATIAFFWLTVRAKLDALALAPEVEKAVYANLMPAIYLQQVADRTAEKVTRDLLRQRSDALLAPLLAAESVLQRLPETELHTIEYVAHECVNLFQRSSSCVEGRNGQLALRHHSLHRLSDRTLGALTTIHNFYLQRNDGTTAAERFFETKPRDLFTWLLERVDMPGRPARKRPRPQPRQYLHSARV